MTCAKAQALRVTGSVAVVLALAALASARALDAPSATVTITVQPGARQTFGEFGASLLNFNGDYQMLTRPQARSLSRIV